MPNFSYPFPFDYLKIDGEKLRSALQQCIADEYEAASRYRAIALLSEDGKIKKILNDIADEEIVHVGEFQILLDQFFPEDVELVEKGNNEVIQKIEADKKEKDEEEESGLDEEEVEEVEEELEIADDGETEEKETKVSDKKENKKIKLIKVRK